MAPSANPIKDSNGKFYSRGDAALFSNAYSVPLSWIPRTFNSIGSLLYVVSSTVAALRVKDACRIYAFVRRAGQTDLAGAEVLSWARAQASDHGVDYYMWGILLLGAALMITQVVTKLFIKKYVVYKLERRILWITLVLTILQWGLALWGSLHLFVPSFRVLWTAEVFVPGIIVLLALTVVFLLGLFAAKLPYPLEFKQYENLEKVLKIANSVADILQRLILR